MTLLALLALLAPAAFAATPGTALESGFFLNGKKYVVFRNGEKVGKTFAETQQEEKQRNPASLTETISYLGYQDDYPDLRDSSIKVRCYSSPSAGVITTVSCVRIK